MGRRNAAAPSAGLESGESADLYQSFTGSRPVSRTDRKVVAPRAPFAGPLLELAGGEYHIMPADNGGIVALFCEALFTHSRFDCE